jgi:hypothetical protein
VCVATLSVFMIPFMLECGDHVADQLDLDFCL